MTGQTSDLTFFTNDKNQTLLDRFKATLADTRLFDVLVGYFRSSGFYQLYDSIERVEKSRILVGLGIDNDAYNAIDSYRNQMVFDFESHKKAKTQFQENLIEEIEHTEESDAQLELGLTKFIEFFQTNCPEPETDQKNGGNGKKLEIRAFPSRNIHAKVYIGRFTPEDRDYGFVITGSSNFSYSGLVANREFNVELRQRRDVEFALDQFEELWRQSVDISRDFVDAVRNKTWFNDTISPYALYLKLIYEYIQEDINLRDDIEIFLPEGFLSLQYQQQAVQQAMKKLNEYNGVFLADVVGLGKTFITAQLLQQIKGRIMVICPPVLKSLNSSISHFYSLLFFVGKENGYYEVKPDNLEKFPIPVATSEAVHCIGTISSYLVNYLAYSREVTSKLIHKYFESVIDALVFELYFPSEIKASNKEILPHIGDLSLIADHMTQEQKIAVIEREFERLYDPRHPVRNHVETLDSVQVVKTIREALKR